MPLWDQFLSIKRLMSRNIFYFIVIFVAFAIFKILVAIPNSANHFFVSQPSIVLTQFALILCLKIKKKNSFLFSKVIIKIQKYFYLKKKISFLVRFGTVLIFSIHGFADQILNKEELNILTCE